MPLTPSNLTHETDFQFRKQENLVSMEDAVLAQICVSQKIHSKFKKISTDSSRRLDKNFDV